MEFSSRPNILIVMCDQLSALATSVYGNGDVLSPNLDKLAERGTLFENAYCNAPLCAPSRASFMSGTLPGRIPVNDNGEELPASVPTFAHHLRSLGYKTILSGKMHFVGPDQLHGFEERLTTDIYPSDMVWTPDWRGHGTPPRGPERGGSREGNPKYMAEMVLESGPVPSSLQLDYDEETHFRAIERIRKLARQEPKPWLMCVSYTQPHDPYAPAQEYWDRYDGRHLTLPVAPPPGSSTNSWDSSINSWHGVDVANPDEDAVYKTRRGYYAMVSYIDDKLGELEKELERFGLTDSTVVVFVSDHGDMVGENDMFFKRTFREWSTRVPLIFAGPSIPVGKRRSETVSLVDVFPTLVGMGRNGPSGFASPPELDGTDLLSGQQGSDNERAVIIDYNAEGVRGPTRTVVQAGYKYVYIHENEELLFHLVVDPGEWFDLSAESEYEEILSKMRLVCFADWDPFETLDAVLASQEKRMFLDKALSLGIQSNWDYRPPFDPQRMYVRRPVTRVWDHAAHEQWESQAGAGD